MQITFAIQATAASDGAKKGDTVAIKVSARSWMLGTVLSKRGGNFNVDTHDGEYQIEVEDEGNLLKKVDLSYMTAKALKVAMKQEYTASQLKALKPPVAAKPAVKTPVKAPKSQPAQREKPAPKSQPAPPAPPPISAFTFRDTYSTTPLTPETMPAGLDNPTTYAASLYGRVVTTGRASSHMSDVVIVGNAEFKGRTCWVGYPHRNRTGKPRLLYYPLMSVTTKMLSSPQISYHDFLKFRNLAAQSLNSLNDSRAQVNQKSLEVQNTLAIRAGYRALIAFSNGNFWKEILEVDPVKRIIYITGSRTKRRTVPFALIKQVAVINGDQNPTTETQIVPPTAPQKPTSQAPVDPFLQRVYKKLNRANFRPHAGDDLVLKPGPGEYSDVYVSVDHLVSNDVMVLTVSRGQMKANTVVFVRKVGIWNENDPALPAEYKKYL